MLSIFVNIKLNIQQFSAKTMLVKQMSSIYFESNGKTLETQPEFLGEYTLVKKTTEEIFPRQKHMLDNSSSYYFRVRSFQMDGDDESPIYYQRGKLKNLQNY